MRKLFLLYFSLFLFTGEVFCQLFDSYSYPTKLSPIPSYYGISISQNTPFIPFELSRSYTSDENELGWYSPVEPVIGFRITEYGDFFLNRIYPFIINIFSSTPPSYYYEWDNSRNKWTYAGMSRGKPGVSLPSSPSGSYIEMYNSDEFFKFYLAASYQTNKMSSIGFGFGMSKIKNVTLHNMKATGDFGSQLYKLTNRSIVVNGGSTLNFLDVIFSWNLDVKYLGTIKFTHTIPPLSLFTPTTKMKLGVIELGAFPFVGASVHRSIGPISVGVEVNTPAKFIFIPWYMKATELKYSLRLAF